MLHEYMQICRRSGIFALTMYDNKRTFPRKLSGKLLSKICQSNQEKQNNNIENK